MSKTHQEKPQKISISSAEAPISTHREQLGITCLFLLLLAACSTQNKAHHSFQQNTTTNKAVIATDVPINTFLNDSSLAHALVGVCIYDVETKKYMHQYNEDKYFVSASNTKLFTCYAAMKYLGDSLVGLRYSNFGLGIAIVGTGDPTFLHSDFKMQPVYDFLKGKHVFFHGDMRAQNKFSPLGDGWAWNDYEDYYMPERSAFPIYGNCAKFYIQDDTLAVVPNAFYNNDLIYFSKRLKNGDRPMFKIKRSLEENFFGISGSESAFSHQYVPFKITSGLDPRGVMYLKLLEDTLGNRQITSVELDNHPSNIIYSQPTDSLLKITMHRSDNFFAEQTLLMVSNEKLGFMSDEKIIDTLLKTDLKDLPQLPNWVDGSGLSRYNLFTPQDFVYILEKMKNEFGLARLQNILPTGNTGTLAGLYKNLNGKIFAKTGTLGNQVALSGFLTTQKGKLLIFSVLVNNHMNSAGNVRRAVEKFINQVWQSE